MAAGASLGNDALFVSVKSTGAVERVFSTRAGRCLVGSIRIQYAAAGGPLVRHLHPRPDTASQGYVPLRQEAPGEFEIAPAYQRHRFVLPGPLHVGETVFVPLSSLDDDRGDPPLVYQMVAIENRSPHRASLRITAFARMRGDTPPDILVRHDSQIDALVATNASDSSELRVFGCTASGTRGSSTSDFGSAYDPTLATTLDGAVNEAGDVLACLQCECELASGESKRFAFVTGIYPSLKAAHAEYPPEHDPGDVLTRTEEVLRSLVRTSHVVTPDRQINLGAVWSKVNMRRVMARYPTGRAFTNEPGVSSNVVARDAVWFTFGCDHFAPDFSRSLIEAFAALQYPDGKIAEYYNALTHEREDYGLNINDDTPLFVMAVNHHYRSTGDMTWLRSIFPTVERAARFIISQMDERGLVICTSTDPRGDVWGIAGWRNIIPGYGISGAVTEINALCAAALRSARHLAENLDHKGVAKEFAAAFDRVRKAMETHLRNPENGLFYLNIDMDGARHSDVTGDELFPVMCRVTDDETSYRIISRLNSPDFWTRAGLRTVSRDDPLYDPARATGLLGGVWPGLTWWYAFAAARYHPEFMVRALRSSFEHYASDPAAHNTVPGEFSEWFDGETLVNRGMRLSPWEPPRFLWAAIEGVCGFSVRPDHPVVQPLIPPSWRWVGVRSIPYHGTELTFFAVRQENKMCVYANREVVSSCEPHTFDQDVTDSVEVLAESAAAIALRRGPEMVVLVGNAGTQTMTAPVDLSRAVQRERKYALRIFNSERDRWIDGETLTGAELASLAVPIERNGYRLIELKEIK